MASQFLSPLQVATNCYFMSRFREIPAPWSSLLLPVFCNVIYSSHVPSLQPPQWWPRAVGAFIYHSQPETQSQSQHSQELLSSSPLSPPATLFQQGNAFSSFICLLGWYVIRAGVLMGNTKWSFRGAAFGSQSSQGCSCPCHWLCLLP